MTSLVTGDARWEPCPADCCLENPSQRLGVVALCYLKGRARIMQASLPPCGDTRPTVSSRTWRLSRLESGVQR